MNPQMLLRGFGKFIAVVVVAGLAGALIGIGLAKLSGNDASSDPAIPASTATSTTPERTQTTARSGSTATTTTPARTTSTTTSKTSTTASDGVYRVPRVQVVSAELGPASESTGRALVAVRARVTNRGNRPLTIKTPVLVSGDDEVSLARTRRDAAGALLKPIEPGATASGTLRFTVGRAVAQRLADSDARLRVANRTVTVKLTQSEGAG
jgi:hypothetical protein